jgi:hypothetical protein
MSERNGDAITETYYDPLDGTWKRNGKPVTEMPAVIERKTITVGEGKKFDTDKLPYDLLPGDAIEEIVKVLQFGAVKYGERNWEKGMRWNRPFAALMRHMWAWWKGEEKDPETGLSHLAHAGCCILFLLSYTLRGVGEDNRP